MQNILNQSSTFNFRNIKNQTIEKIYKIHPTSLKTIEKNKQTFNLILTNLIKKLIYKHREVKIYKSMKNSKEFKKAANTILQTFTKEIILNSENETKLKNFFKNCLEEYKKRYDFKNLNTKLIRHAISARNLNKKKLEDISNKIYLNFIVKFQVLQSLPRITQKDLDDVLTQFHCDTKTELYNIFFKNVTKQNFDDCIEPSIFVNDTGKYIPWKNEEEKVLYFDTNCSDQILLKQIGAKESDYSGVFVVGVLFILFIIISLFKLVLRWRKLLK
ncbi:hypothetical protein TUBRATIS_20440 [Tubulinosema ratisbonensis]|uniref:Uncharacterized protein n=1 Tax=Tubulinosema ratisbonensis TaxID=291195 RepID=A0A437AKA9_9MICR|nr:hypothetical protein TUBRATIS_20440 [Tubulinosema ratisbonensis]